MEMIFDDFDAQLQCEDIQAEYIPTEQDLLDMEAAFALDPMEVVEQLEAIIQEFNSNISVFKSFSAKIDFDLDDLF